MAADRCTMRCISEGVAKIERRSGWVLAAPEDIPQAAEMIRASSLDRLCIVAQGRVRRGAAVDLQPLDALPSLRSFGVVGVGEERLRNLDAISACEHLVELHLGSCRQVDLSPFARIERLTIGDSAEVTGIGSLSSLRHLTWHRLERTTVGALAALPLLQTLRLTDTRSRSVVGLNLLPALERLELGRSRRLRSVGQLPTSLRHLTVGRCPRLDIPLAVHGNSSLESLMVEELPNVAFVQTLPALSYLGFLDCVADDLTLLLRSRSLVAVSFGRARRYSHSPEEINESLAARRRQFDSLAGSDDAVLRGLLSEAAVAPTTVWPRSTTPLPAEGCFAKPGTDW